MTKQQIIVDAFLRRAQAEHAGVSIEEGRELIHADMRFDLTQKGITNEEIDEVLDAWFRHWEGTGESSSGGRCR